MQKIEYAVYNLVKKNPDLKIFLRNLYQDLFALIPIQKKTSKYNIQTREGFFFGFHDHSPFAANNEFLLANKYTIPLRYPRPHETLDVGFFSGPSLDKWNYIDKTLAWNWHMGSKLQWVGGQRAFIYNDFNSKNHTSKIYNIDQESYSYIDHPVGTVSLDGKWAVGYGFERVQKYMPGYGYIQKGTEKEIEKKTTENSFLYIINLETGVRKNLLSVAQLARIQPEHGSENAYHFISHTVFSPSSKRIVFLHRWVTENRRNRKTRMFTCDLDGENLCLFPTKEMVSHIGWRGADEIIAYARLKDGTDAYVLFKDQSEEYRIIARGAFNSDGHPSFSPNGRWMLTDTYPDKTRRSYVCLYDLNEDKRYNIAYLHSPKKFRSNKKRGHISCDLHPRWDRLGEIICFDSVYNGVRSLCTIELGNLNSIEQFSL